MNEVEIDVGLAPMTFIRLIDAQTGQSLAATLDYEGVQALVTQLIRAFPMLDPQGDASETGPLFALVDPDVSVDRVDGQILFKVEPVEMPPFEISFTPLVSARLSDRLAEEAY